MTREGPALFDSLPAERERPEGRGETAPPRLRRAERRQVELRAVSLEDLLPAEHRARFVWAFAEGLDLSALYARIKAVEGAPGHPPAGPRLLVALWLYATIEGVGSAWSGRPCVDGPFGARVLCGLDATARVMKMADGGFRPAYNLGFASDPALGMIAAVCLDNRGTDMGKLAPMSEALARDYGCRPGEHLADGGFVALAEIEALAAQDVRVFAPVPKPRDQGRDRHVPLATEPKATPAGRYTPALAKRRSRMGSDAAKAIYKHRAATTECASAQCRNRGLLRFTVRGAKKAIIAVAAAMLTAAYFMLRDGVAYRDLGPIHLDQRHRDNAIRRLLRRLDDLGYQMPIPHGAS